MKKVSQNESKKIVGGVTCPYCAWTDKKTGCSGQRSRDLHIKNRHVPTWQVRSCL